jgi:hypothetical protein
VDVKASRLAEALSTVLAAEGSALGVGVLVVPQVVLPSKGLATHITWKGPLIGVSTLMDEQVVGLGELPVAELADKPLLRLCNGSTLLLVLQHVLKNQVGREVGGGRGRRRRRRQIGRERRGEGEREHWSQLIHVCPG